MDDETVRDHVDDVWNEETERWMKEELDEAERRVVEELELLEGFEYFWDGDVDRVGYEAPSIPRDWKNTHGDVIDGWSQVSKINMSLGELGEDVRAEVEDRLGVGEDS